jgi:VanZ family protein
MKFLRYWKTIICFILIVTASIIPGNEFKDFSIIHMHGFDKIMHFTMYFILCFFAIYESPVKIKPPNLYLLALIFPIITGLALEIIQYLFISNREGNSIDFIANCIGVITSFILFSRKKLKKYPNR